MAQLPERPSAWGGLSAIFDTPAKQWTVIGVLLLVMAVLPFFVNDYITVIVTHALLYVVLALGLLLSSRPAAAWTHAAVAEPAWPDALRLSAIALTLGACVAAAIHVGLAVRRCPTCGTVQARGVP